MEKWSFCLREKWWNFGSNSYQSSFPKPWHSWHRVSKRLGSPGCATVPSPHTTWFLFVKGIPGRLHKECAFPQPLTKVLVTKLMLKERKVRGSFLQHWMVGRGRVRGLELKWKLWILGCIYCLSGCMKIHIFTLPVSRVIVPGRGRQTMASKGLSHIDCRTSVSKFRRCTLCLKKTTKQ